MCASDLPGGKGEKGGEALGLDGLLVDLFDHLAEEHYVAFFSVAEAEEGHEDGVHFLFVDGVAFGETEVGHPFGSDVSGHVLDHLEGPAFSVVSSSSTSATSMMRSFSSSSLHPPVRLAAESAMMASSFGIPDVLTTSSLSLMFFSSST